MYHISFVLIFCFHFEVRKGSKYQDGLLVGADYETEITEWYSGDNNFHTDNEIDHKKASKALAITDESKLRKISTN